MNKKEIIKTAKKTSKERGYKMYIIFNSLENTFSFTQDKNIFLADNEKITHEVDEENVIKL